MTIVRLFEGSECLKAAKLRGAKIVLTSAYHAAIIGPYDDNLNLIPVKRYFCSTISPEHSAFLNKNA